MAAPTISQPNQIANPGLKDLLDVMKTNTLINTNCHAVATVQSFSQGVVNGIPNGLYTVNATINYSRTYWVKQADGTYLPQQQSYPTLVDCPVIVLGGGSTFLSFPIKEGDQCLILFNDRDLNNWFAGARSGPVATARLHAFADAIALVGFNPVNNFDSGHALLSNGNAEVGVPADPGTGLVRIANSSTTLYTLLSDLITAINAITILGGAVSPASQAALNIVKSDISGLLE